MLDAIVDFLQQLLDNVGEQIAIGLGISLAVDYLKSLLSGGQGGQSWVVVSNEVESTALTVENGVWGNEALYNALETAYTNLLAAINGCQQSGSPVTLPSSPPSGGSWLGTGNAGSTIWSYIVPGTGYEAGTLLGFAGSVAYQLGLQGVMPVYQSPFFAALLGIDSFTLAADGPLPVLDLTAVPYPQTLVDALNAQNSAWVFAWYLTDGGYCQSTSGPPSAASVITTLTDEQFQEAVRNAQGIGPAAVAPVWPGLDGVTFGAALDLVDGLVVSGPLMGVSVAITDAPYPISYYPFGTIKSWVRAGAIVFTNDNGDSEFPAPFGPGNQVIVPAMMASAASATVRLASGVTGTIAPFTIP